MAYLNRCIWNSSTSGLSDFKVASAAQNGYTPAQCLVPTVTTGATYHYFAVSSDGTQHEEGDGVYTVATSTLARTTIRNSSNSGNKVNFVTAPIVTMGSPVANDMPGIGNLIQNATSGSVLFAGTNGALAQDNSNFTWDNTNKALTIGGGTSTVTTSTPVFDAAQTWNNGATAFTGIKLNITNTASAATSLLQDWQVGSASKASIDISGNATFQTTLTFAGSTAVFKHDGTTAFLDYNVTRGNSLTFITTTFFAMGGVVGDGPTPTNNALYFNNSGPTYYGVVGCAEVTSVASILVLGRATAINGAITAQVCMTTETGILSFGGYNSASLPGLVNSGAELRVRLSDNSAFADLQLKDIYTNDATYFLRTKTTLTNGAAAQTGTLTNAPAAGNPTKWIAIDDNGTKRQIPAW